MDTQKKYLVDLIVSQFGFPSNNRTEFIRHQQTFLPSLEETDWNLDSGATPPKLMLSFVGWYYSNGWNYSLRFGEMNELGEWRVKQVIVIWIETGGCSILYSRQRPLGQCQKNIQMRLTLNTRLIDNNIIIISRYFLWWHLFQTDQAKIESINSHHHPKVSINISHMTVILSCIQSVLLFLRYTQACHLGHQVINAKSCSPS